LATENAAGRYCRRACGHWVNFFEPNWRWLPPLTGLLTSIAALIFLYPLLHTSPLISIFDRNGIAISVRKSAEIQNLLSWGVINLWIGIMIVGGICAWRLVSLAWQAMPRTVAQSRSNGVAHS